MIADPDDPIGVRYPNTARDPLVSTHAAALTAGPNVFTL